jgi:hypothetical protein
MQIEAAIDDESRVVVNETDLRSSYWVTDRVHDYEMRIESTVFETVF